MAGPWEKYQDPAPEGPWTKYQADATDSPTPGIGERTDDFVRGTVSGLVPGVASVVGAPAALEQGIRYLSRKIKGQTPEEQEADLRKNAFGYTLKDTLPAVDPESLTKAWERNVAPLYQPKGTEGEIGRTLGTFLPASVLGPGGVARNIVTNAVVPTLTSEAAGRSVRDTSLQGLEPYVRGGAAVLSSAGANLLTRPLSGDAAIIQKSEPRLAGDSAAQAKQFMERAAAEGLPTTLDEAAAKTLGGQTGLTGLNRTVTNSPQGRSVANEFYNQRAPATRAIAEQHIADIQGPQPLPSSSAGLAVQKGAEDIITNERRAINATEGPFYTSASTVNVPMKQIQPLLQDPAFLEAWQNVLGDPVRAKALQGLPPNNVGFLTEIRKELAGIPNGLAAKGRQDLARNYMPSLDTLTKTLEQASPDYAKALEVGRTLRQDSLNPLENSVVGAVEKQPNLAAQAGIVFGNRNYSAPEETARLVGSLAKDNPPAANALVAQHLKFALADAFEPVQGQAQNVMAGPKLRNALVDNPSVEAAVKAAAGNTKWQGLVNFFDILEAHNYKPAMGSPTAFAGREIKDISQGGLGSIVADTAKGGVIGPLTAIPRRLSEFYEKTRYGNTSEQIARMLTDQERAGKILDQLAAMNPNSPKAAMLAFRLTYLGQKAAQLGRAGALGYRASIGADGRAGDQTSP